MPETHSYSSLEWLPGDRFCIRRRTTTNAAVARGAGTDRWYADVARAKGADVRTECPRVPVAARPSRQQVLDEAARRFWDVRLLPSPSLSVVPDYALTGKPVYLQIAGPLQQRFQVPYPPGADVVIEASSRYVVDWGDDSAETGTASQGGPWPHGELTHTYTVVSPARTITVTQLWAATWTAGSAG